MAFVPNIAYLSIVVTREILTPNFLHVLKILNPKMTMNVCRMGESTISSSPMKATIEMRVSIYFLPAEPY